MGRTSKGKYSKQVFLGYDSEGKKVQTRVYADTQKDLLKEEARLKLEFESGRNPSTITFKTYSEKWFDAYKSNKSIATQNMYLNALGKASSLDHIRMKDIRPMDLQKIINDNIDKPRTCEQIRLTLRQIFSCAVEDGILNRSPANKLSLPKKPEPVRRTLTDQEKAAILKADLSAQDRMFINVLFYFGLRPGEAVSLMPGDFNLKAGTLTVRRAVEYIGNNIPQLKGTKTDNVRVLPIPHELLPDLRNYIAALGSIYMFPMNETAIMSKSSLKRTWQRITKAINIAMGGNDKMNLVHDLHPYVFRYTYATNLYYSGITVKKASELMGHSDTSMILKVYAQIDNERENLEAVKGLSLSNYSTEIEKKPVNSAF